MSEIATSTQVMELTGATFDEVVGASPVPVLVDFWAEWCPPCHALTPILHEIAAEHAGALRIAKVDVDAHPDLSLRFGAMSIPTLLLFVDGRPVHRMIGARGKRHLLAGLAEHVTL